LGRLIDTY